MRRALSRLGRPGAALLLSLVACAVFTAALAFKLGAF